MIVREVVGRRATARVLVIVPAALRTQWKEELASLLELPSIDAHAAWLRTITRELPPDVNPWSIPGIYLASIDFVKRPEVLGPLESVRWDLLVVDEAHGATPGTDRLAAVDALGCRASIVVLLSATPHSGEQDQFDALCRIGSGAGRSPLVCFRRTRADVDVAQAPVRSRVLAVPPTENERQMHRLLERYTSLLWAVGAARQREPGAAGHGLSQTRPLQRRRAGRLPGPAAGLDGLPAARRNAAAGCHSISGDSKTRRQTRTPTACSAERASTMPPASGRLSSSVSRAAEASSGSESKTARLLRLLSRLSLPGHRFFRIPRHGGAVARADCGDGPPGACCCTAASPRTSASRVTAEFLRGGAVMVATDAASEGLNLHHSCRLVIHYELPWSPARLHQRCGRVNRIGQRRRVHEIALVAARHGRATGPPTSAPAPPGLRRSSPAARSSISCPRRLSRRRSSTAIRSPVAGPSRAAGAPCRAVHHARSQRRGTRGSRAPAGHERAARRSAGRQQCRVGDSGDVAAPGNAANEPAGERVVR